MRCIIYTVRGYVALDVQLKRGLIEVCVLKVLTRGDSYGYQLIKDISPYIELSESTLYPILKRLEAANLLSVYSVEHNSRLRKYYKLTAGGHAKIQAFVMEWQEVMTVYEFIAEDASNDKN